MTTIGIEAGSPKQAFELVCTLIRQVSCQHLTEAIRKAEQAEAVGPLLNPTAWLGAKTFEQHSKNIDIIRRALDLRQAVIDADECAGNDPHQFELK